MCSVCITVNVRLYGFSNCLSLVAPTWPLTIVEEEWKKKCVRLVVMNFRLGTFCFCALLCSHSLSLTPPLSSILSLSLSLAHTLSSSLRQTHAFFLLMFIKNRASRRSDSFLPVCEKKEIRVEKKLFRILSGFPDWELSSTFLKKIFEKSVRAITNKKRRSYDFCETLVIFSRRFFSTEKHIFGKRR